MYDETLWKRKTNFFFGVGVVGSIVAVGFFSLLPVVVAVVVAVVTAVVVAVVAVHV